MEAEVIETDKYIMRVHDDTSLIEYIVKPEVIIDKDTVVEGKKKISDLRPGIKFYVLGEGVEFFTLTKEARELCATAQFLDNTHAVAFYTKNISIMLLGEIFNKINKPAVPTKIFTDKEKAREWLEELMKQTGSGDEAAE